MYEKLIVVKFIISQIRIRLPFIRLVSYAGISFSNLILCIHTGDSCLSINKIAEMLKLLAEKKAHTSF